MRLCLDLVLTNDRYDAETLLILLGIKVRRRRFFHGCNEAENAKVNLESNHNDIVLYIVCIVKANKNESKKEKQYKKNETYCICVDAIVCRQ